MSSNHQRTTADARKDRRRAERRDQLDGLIGKKEERAFLVMTSERSLLDPEIERILDDEADDVDYVH